MNLLPDISKHLTPEVLSTFAEVHQPRSRFQLENFVIGAHATSEMQYYQIITEIQALYYTIKQVSLELQKTEIQISRLRATGDEIDELDAQIKELGIDQTRVVGVGAFRELEILLELKSQMPEYSRIDIEKNQSKYWQLRLNKSEIDSTRHAITP